MQSDFKLMISGFLVGLAVGAFALTSVGASIGSGASVGDRLPMPDRPTLTFDNLDANAVNAVLPVRSAPGAATEYYDARGVLVYRSDPQARMTTVLKGAVIPTATPAERDQMADPQHMVDAGMLHHAGAN